MADAPVIQAFFDEPTNTVTYLVSDPATHDAVVIDPVLDYDHASGTADTRSAEALLAVADAASLRIVAVLETHAHADHLTAAPFLKARTGAWVGIGAHITKVQAIFAPVFGATDVAADGSAFDRLLADGDRVMIGNLVIDVMDTPGHTPADVSYRIGDAVFVGDTLFMPDYGTARADFPGGDARQLYRSVRRLLDLPGETRLFLCHDYKAPGRGDYRWETTVAEQRAANVHVHDGISEDAFADMRTRRDATLAAPKLLLPSIQVNIRAGHLPPTNANGTSYLRVPVKLAGGASAAINPMVIPKSAALNQQEGNLPSRIETFLTPGDKVAAVIDPTFRLLTSLIFIIGGLGHFGRHDDMLKRMAASPWADIINAIGDPAIPLWLSGAVFVLCGITLAIGWMTRLSALALIVTLVPITITIHIAPDHIGPLFKNVAILGALVLIWARGPGVYALDRTVDQSS